MKKVSSFRRIKRLCVLVLAALLLFSLGGCAAKSEANTSTEAPQPETAPISYADATVSYLGPEGTYTQEACQVFFDREGSYLPYTTVNDAVQALAVG